MVIFNIAYDFSLYMKYNSNAKYLKAVTTIAGEAVQEQFITEDASDGNGNVVGIVIGSISGVLLLGIAVVALLKRDIIEEKITTLRYISVIIDSIFM